MKITNFKIEKLRFLIHSWVKGYRFESDMPHYNWRVTFNYNFSPFKKQMFVISTMQNIQTNYVLILIKKEEDIFCICCMKEQNTQIFLFEIII